MNFIQSQVEIYASNITNNLSSNIGSIYCVKSVVSLNQNIFEKNEAFIGGAINIQCQADCTTVLNQNSFKNNTANIGGAVFIDGDFDDSFISNNEFEDNQAIDYGPDFGLRASSISILYNQTPLKDD